MRIIDTHQHLWDLRRFHLPWAEKHPLLGRNFLMADYLAAAEGTGIEKTVYMEVDLAHRQQQAEVDYVTGLCRADDNPMVAAVVSGLPGEDGFEDYAGPLRDNPFVKGIRRVLHGSLPPGHCLGQPFLRDIRLLGQLGLSYDICIRSKELSDTARLVEACPDTRFILDHCGNPDVLADDDDHLQWQRDIESVARHDNVVCKVSGFIWTVRRTQWSVETIRPIVDHVVDSFGPERVMFGGDWPVCTQSVTLARWVAALKEAVADRPIECRNGLFFDNAVRVYGLEDAQHAAAGEPPDGE